MPNLQALALEEETKKVTINDARWGDKKAWDCTFFLEIQRIPPGANNKDLDSLCAEFFEFYAKKVGGVKALSGRAREWLREKDSLLLP